MRALQGADGGGVSITPPAPPRRPRFADLIRKAQEDRPIPIIDGLLNENQLMLIHGTEECFKSVFVMQIAACLAEGLPLLRLWPIPQPRCVGVLETEMDEGGMGDRAAKMFDGRTPPDNAIFYPNSELKEWRRASMQGKFTRLENWIKEDGLEVLIVDTANDFFRGNADPSVEQCAGGFFDNMRNLPVKARIIVRHDRKSHEDTTDLHSNEKIRGSGEWKEDPETILYMQRVDRRTNQAWLDVGKLRYGMKPEPLNLWFDAGNFLLTPLPPIIALLAEEPLSRSEILTKCKDRFDLGQRKVDEMLKQEGGFVQSFARGHEKVFRINKVSMQDAPWGQFLPKIAETDGEQVLYNQQPASKIAEVQDYGCTSPRNALREDVQSCGSPLE